MKILSLALMAALLVASPALANQCPLMIQQIEERLAESAVSEATRSTVRALLAEGQALHRAGDHAAAEAKLAEALSLLGS
jgi:hypothetical protein